MGSEMFEPLLVVPVKSGFVVIYKHGSCYVHSVYESEAFEDAALADAIVNLVRDVDEGHALGQIEPEFFAVALHEGYFDVRAVNKNHNNTGNKASSFDIDNGPHREYFGLIKKRVTENPGKLDLYTSFYGAPLKNSSGIIDHM
jgi:hypothetical protein